MELAGVAPDVRRDRAEAALAQVGLADGRAASAARALGRDGAARRARPGVGRRSSGAAARRAVQRARRAHPRGVRRRAPASLARAAAHRGLRHPQRRRGRRPRRSRRRHDPAAGARRASRGGRPPAAPPRRGHAPTRVPRRSRPRSGTRSHRSMRSSCDRGPRRPRWVPHEAHRVGHRQPGGLPRDLEARDRHRRPAGVHPSGTGGRGGARGPGRRLRRPLAARRRHVARDRPRLRRRRDGRHRGGDRAGEEPLRRARPVALHRRRAGDPDPGARAAARHLVRRRALRAGRGLRAHRLLPDHDRHDGRHPLDRPASRRGVPQPRRELRASERGSSRSRRPCR